MLGSVRLENYPQCATHCATQWDSQNHIKSANAACNVKVSNSVGLIAFDNHMAVPAKDPSVAPITLIRNKSGEENSTPMYIRMDAGMSLMA